MISVFFSQFDNPDKTFYNFHITFVRHKENMSHERFTTDFRGGI